ncbi:hypothetical protein [Streptomyces sp. MS1.AVA.4]|uniref:Uncharacterized protein n=1 Tax=Streptomyces pratisoli TaxID=3139917 RepID=A0ACC6QHE9_9ACTN
MSELIRQVTDRDARKRELTADRVPDWLGSYSLADGRLRAGVLSAAAAGESDMRALEAQLNALLALGAGGLTDLECLGRLHEVDFTGWPAELVDYMHDLLDIT